MNVNEAIEYIHSVFWKGSVYGLSRIRTLLEKMGNPQNDLKYIHIAGTNGKGSTAAMTASILRKAGYEVEPKASKKEVWFAVKDSFWAILMQMCWFTQ
mgnify:CR=1 FL=1